MSDRRVDSIARLSIIRPDKPKAHDRAGVRLLRELLETPAQRRVPWSHFYAPVGNADRHFTRSDGADAMPVKLIMLTAAMTVFAFVGSEGFAQDVSGVDPNSSPPGTAGHTLNELRKGIKEEAKRVGQTIGEVGREIKAETRHVTSEVAQRFDAVKADVHRMPAQHGIYSRLHWDKLLHDATIEVHILRDGAVLLRGTVPTEAAKRHAVELASGSVDVTSVIDELTVSSKVATTRSAVGPKPTTRR